MPSCRVVAGHEQSEPGGYLAGSHLAATGQQHEQDRPPRLMRQRPEHGHYR